MQNICGMNDGSHLHNDQLVLGAAEILELLSKTQGHCWIWSGNLTLLVLLQSWNMQRKANILKDFAGTAAKTLLA